MGRRETVSDDETDSESAEEEEVTESEESVPTSSKKEQPFNIPTFSFSYKQLPKKCIKFSFLCVNGATFVRVTILTLEPCMVNYSGPCISGAIYLCILQLSGITALIISIWMLADGKLMSRLVGQRLFVTILLFVGLLTSMMAFLGILAILRKRRRFLIIYIICHVVSLCVIFVCAVMSFSFFDKIMRKVREEMLTTIVNYHSLDWVTEAWDNTHEYLQCCGIKSYRDWHLYNMKIPQSCCSSSIDKCLVMTEELAYKNGCLKRTLILLKSNVHAVAVSALFIAITLAVGVFLAVGVCKRYRFRRPAAMTS